MQFLLRTLGIIVAWFAVAFAIGKANGAAACLLFVGGSAFVAPAFVLNVWIRVAAAIVMATVATDLFGLAFEPLLADDPAETTGEHFMRATPATIVIGALAVTVSSGICWIVVTSYRDFLRRYIDHCRSKASDVVAAKSVEVLSAPCGFVPKTFSRGELHVYNIRHIQHHAARLILRLRLRFDDDIPWLGTGWKEA
ncbi:hypothetical protein [Blastopirellula retiformator]|uniref:Uncharacterized protein n=1 Tax=Blastopirellula retiformator TaxID=2527970 RepID=A0A5C5VLB7_9BACT|nr:hypothetical protein [Blastopirellula retiformator]TWT38512.1 hypothetical protein Enr8_02050 [Blastopirellula retiformator]